MNIRRLAAVAALGVASNAFAAGVPAVDGYVRKDGAYVPPLNQTDPNSIRLDNYGTRVNVNPYTGQRATPTHPPNPTTTCLGRRPLSSTRDRPTDRHRTAYPT